MNLHVVLLQQPYQSSLYHSKYSLHTAKDSKKRHITFASYVKTTCKRKKKNNFSHHLFIYSKLLRSPNSIVANTLHYCSSSRLVLALNKPTKSDMPKKNKKQRNQTKPKLLYIWSTFLKTLPKRLFHIHI